MSAPSLFLALTSIFAAGPDTLVVCPPDYLGALQPWVAYRTAQGHSIAFISNAGTAVQIREAIRLQAKSGDLRFIVLVGDAEPFATFESDEG